MRLSIFFIALIFLSSCSKDMSKAFDKAKDKCDNSKNLLTRAIPAKKCHEWYPVKTDSFVTERIIKGDVVEVPGEFVYVPYDCDSALRKEYEERYKDGAPIRSVGKIIIKVPVYRAVDTNLIIRTIVAKDMAEIASKDLEIVAYKEAVVKCQEKSRDDLHEKNERIAKVTGQRNWTAGFLLLLVVAVCVMFYLKIKNII